MTFYAAHKFRPRTRHMYLEEDRLNSFHCKTITGRFITWPKSLKQSPKSLAKSGFFYTGYSDIVICFYCDLHLMSWEPSDSPTIEHCRHSPYCSFMTHKHGIKYMSFFKPFGLTEWTLKRAFHLTQSLLFGLYKTVTIVHHSFYMHSQSGCHMRLESFHQWLSCDKTVHNSIYD